MQKNKKPKSKEEDGRSMKKDIAAWEKKVATVQKGSYWMWKTDLQIMTDVYTTVYLTAIKDAKICWRLDNFLGAGMTTGMSFWDYEAASGDSNVKSKNWIFVPNVPLVHNIFRKFMGHVDQADVKAHVMGLTKLMSRDWHDKQLYHLIECSVISSHANYNLDPHPEIKPEFFTEWHNNLIAELIEMSPNYRKYKAVTAGRRKMESPYPSSGSALKRRRPYPSPGSARKRIRFSHKKKTPIKSYKSKKRVLGTATERGLRCPMRDRLGVALRLAPKKGTEKNDRPSMRRVVCQFYGRKSTMYVCKGCDQSFCMFPPTNLTIPGSVPPRKFASNGLFCWQLLHGFTSWAEDEK